MPRNGQMADDGLVLDFARHMRGRADDLETRAGLIEDSVTANKEYAENVLGPRLDAFDARKQEVPDLDKSRLSVWRSALARLPQGPASIFILGDVMGGSGFSVPGYGWADRVADLLGRGGIVDLNAVGGGGGGAGGGGTGPTPTGTTAYQGSVANADSSNYLVANTVDRIGAVDPDLVLHVIGSNDYARNVSLTTFKANLRARLREVFAVHAACNQLLVHSSGRGDILSPAHSWDSYGVAMEEVANEPEFASNVSYLDVDAEMKLRGVPLSNSNLIGADLTRLNDRGNRIVADIVCRYLGIPVPTCETECLYGLVEGGDGITDGRTLSTITIHPAPFPRTASVYAQALTRVVSGENAGFTFALPGVATVASRFIPTLDKLVTNQFSHRFQIPAHTGGELTFNLELFPATVNVNNDPSLNHFSVLLTAS